jgi:hypothetical protein
MKIGTNSLFDRLGKVYGMDVSCRGQIYE